MKKTSMTSLERVLTTLNHKEPDRVPLFLLTTMHGAKELGLSVKTYFSKAENVVEGQLRLLKKYRNDCVSPFFYASLEVEAWGAEVIYRDDGPPNSGAPFLSDSQKIRTLEVPSVRLSPCLSKMLKAIRMLKDKVQDKVPIIGVVMSPFSLPVMQMGFDKYIELMYDHPHLFERLMKINEEFCVQWANAQLEAGATAICYFDPVSSTTLIPRYMYISAGFGFEIAKRTLARINGPTATHLASGRCLPIVDDLIKTGTAAIGVSCMESLASIKGICKGKVSILGNLNGIEMARWTPEYTENIVKESIAKAAKGGGYILSDNHGEIPFQVPEKVLLAISQAVHKWGRYPLNWIEDYEK